ncbi:glycoside hydrolase family 3 protein [Stipitochalara longipes BDJ]|nr:glycoside hydrolase family 3 protein [Stipitochalara longipes BDJ]
MYSILLPLATLTASAFAVLQPANTTILGPYGHSPPVYPSPNTTGVGGWEDALLKAKAFVAPLTTEKAWMTTGANGPCVGNLLRFLAWDSIGCVVFPAGVTVAATWDRDLMYQQGAALGAEFKAKGAHSLGSQSLGGRNWEGFATDLYLTGVAMEETITGIQSTGVQASAKHIIKYEQETQRVAIYTEPEGTDVFIAPYSSNIGDRTAHEFYLWAFGNAVRAGVASVMCSYNRVNGSQACQNSKTLNGLLKQELGFQGYVVSNWGAVYSGVSSIEAGVDMNQPGGMGVFGSCNDPASYFGDNVTEAVNNGTIDISRLDDMITRIMTPYYFLGQDQYFPTVDPSKDIIYQYAGTPSTWAHGYILNGISNRDVRGDHHKIIRENVNNALHLKAPKTIVVFGNAAGDDTQGAENDASFEYGALCFTYLVTHLDALKQRNPTAFMQIVLNNTLVAEKVCLVFLKAFRVEGSDRKTMEPDYNGTAVVESVASYCNNTIVVTHAMGPTTLSFADHPNVTAILLGHYPGQELGNSLIDILYGDQAWFDEKLEVDYRYFDANNISVQYEFGYGLSNTTFELLKFSVSKSSNATIATTPAAQATAPGGNPALWDALYNATFSIANTGSVMRAQVPQLYIGFPISTPPGTPPQQLRGFEKVSLAPNGSAEVSLPLLRRDLSYWDVVTQGWIIPAGEFALSIGFSSRDLKMTTSLTVI